MVKVREGFMRTPHATDWLTQLPTPELRNSALLTKTCELLESHGALESSDTPLSLFEQGREIVWILAPLAPEAEILAATLIYPFLKKNPNFLATVAECIGPSLAKCLEGVQQMDLTGRMYHLQGEKKSGSLDKLRKMLIAMVEDVRIVLVKLATIIFDLRHAHEIETSEKLILAEEALDIYAPLANRLGIGQFKWEIEDLSFRMKEPETYKQIASWLDEKRLARENYIQQVIKILQTALEQNQIKAEISGRAKHIVSIVKKMRKKNLDYHQIYDIRAVRILVPTVKDCYAALGTVHTLWQHIAKEFDDYIATPKSNGYRSLHTAVTGPDNKTLEVQIRTHEMDRQAELGVAAHWRYKEGVFKKSDLEEKTAWLRQVLAWQAELPDTQPLIQELHSDAFLHSVYVFTPGGDVIDLPHNSTPLDFAYAIHSELGHRCRGAKINGKIVPLTYHLQSGEIIEILKTKEGGPSRDWLNPHLGYLKSTKAKSKVHQWFKAQDYDVNVREGRNLFERERERLGLDPIEHDSLAARFGFKKGSDFFAAIGSGDLRIGQITNGLQPYLRSCQQKTDLKTPQKNNFASNPDKSSGILVHGESRLLTHIAKCCKPIPGEAVLGFITKGQGISIHRQDCQNVEQLSQNQHERVIEVEWNENLKQSYEVDLYVLAYDRQGLVRDISKVLANEHVNVTEASTKTYKNTQIAELSWTLEVNSLETLSKIMGLIEQIPNVFEVRRKKEGGSGG